MAKLLAWFPWFASALLLAGCYAQEKVQKISWHRKRWAMLTLYATGFKQIGMQTKPRRRTSTSTA